MIRSEGRTVRYSELGPSISNLVQLKLIESQHTTSNRPRRHPYSKNALSSNINTPSTANDLQNFHSCHIDKRREVNKPLASLRLTGKDRGCESATKILTLREIKVEEFKARQKEEIKQSPSRKIFVSISRQNSGSLQKKKQIQKKEDPEINGVECWHAEQKHHRPGIKLNIYKDIARKRINLM